MLKILIILEGADGTGKSTLADNLMRLLKGVKILVNYSYPREKTKQENLAYARGEYEASLRIFEKITDKVWIIADRFHLGEYVYGRVMRNYTEKECEETVMRIEDRLLNRLGGTLKVRLIVASCPTDIAWKRLKETETYITGSLVLQQLLIRYVNAFNLSILPKLYLDTHKFDKQECMLKALKFIEEYHRPGIMEEERFIG